MIKSFVRWNLRSCERLARRYPRFFGYPSYSAELEGRIRSSLQRSPASVLEAGGIDRPRLRRGCGFIYDGLDIEDKPACHEIYDHFLVQSIEDPVPRRYGVVFSMTLLEHVPDNRASVRAMFEALEPGGETHHYVPGSNHPYALATRLVGARLQKILIRVLRPNVDPHTSGYPTYFNHCTPKAMTQCFREAGFEEVDVRVFYRANEYFAWFLPIYVLVTAFENLCRDLDWRQLGSGFVISGRKPVADAESRTAEGRI